MIMMGFQNIKHIQYNVGIFPFFNNIGMKKKTLDMVDNCLHNFKLSVQYKNYVIIIRVKITASVKMTI